MDGRVTKAVVTLFSATVALVFYGAIRASFSGLTELALQAGWHPDEAWLLPLCIDALIGMALLLYVLTKLTRALVIAVLAAAASVAGNGASHWFEVSGVPVPLPVVVLVGAVPALSLLAASHMLAHTIREKLWNQQPKKAPAGARGKTPTTTGAIGRLASALGFRGRTGTDATETPSPDSVNGTGPRSGGTASGSATGTKKATASTTARGASRSSSRPTDEQRIARLDESRPEWRQLTHDEIVSALGEPGDPWRVHKRRVPDLLALGTSNGHAR